MWLLVCSEAVESGLVQPKTVWPVKSCQMSIKVCPKMISLEKWNISATLQKLPKIVGKIIVARGFEKLPKVQ